MNLITKSAMSSFLVECLNEAYTPKKTINKIKEDASTLYEEKHGELDFTVKYNTFKNYFGQ